MTTPNLNHRLIADRVLCRRDDLRAIPGDMQAACDLARQMVHERELFDAEDRAPYNTYRYLDALLAMIEGTALYLADQISEAIGENDSDLPTIQ